MRKRPMLIAVVFTMFTIMLVAGFVLRSKSGVQADRLDVKQVKNLTRSLEVVSVAPLPPDNHGLTLTLKNVSKREITWLIVQSRESFSGRDLTTNPLKPGATAKYDFFRPGIMPNDPPTTLKSSDLKIVVALLKGDIIDGSLRDGNMLVEMRLGEMQELKRASAVLSRVLTLKKQDESIKMLEEEFPLAIDATGAIRINSDRERGISQARQVILRMLHTRGVTRSDMSMKDHQAAIERVRKTVVETIEKKEKQ